MDKEWWEFFLESTEQMENTKVFSDLISDDVSWYQNTCMFIIKLIALEKREKPRFRVWIDRDIKTQEYKDKIYQNPPEEFEGLDKWAKRVFGDQKFGMIITDIEAFSDSLNKKIATVFEPLIANIGIPTGGIVMGIFLGNYGYTPLGIHLDAPQEKIFHFHLGPGEKKMFEWDQEVYKDINGGIIGYQEVEEVIDHAIKHSFKAGDLFYMPQKKFHIGYSGELSMDLAIGFNNDPKNNVTQKIFGFKEEHIKKSEGNILTDEYFNLNDSFSVVYNKIKPLFEIAEEYEDLTVKEYVSELISDYQLCLAANQGFYCKQLNSTPDISHDELQGKTVALSKPFKIFYKMNAENAISVFTRGYKFSIWYHEAIPQIINELNEGNELEVNKVIEPLLNEWSEEVALYFISLLVNYNGITITN